MCTGFNNIVQGYLECRRRHQIERLRRKMNTAIQNLNQAVVALNNLAPQVITILATPNPNDPQIQAAADSINSVVSSITAALPAAPAPVSSATLKG